MTSQKRLVYLLASLLLFALSIAPSAPAQKGDKKKEKKDKTIVTGPPILWREPTDLATRDLSLGPTRGKLQPDLRRVTFLKEEQGGYSTKYRVRDAAGQVWVAKIGKEAQTDVAANRLIWAVGFNCEISFLVPRVTIEGKGTFEEVRFEARPANIERGEIWSWDNNPFVGTAEFQGLKVMMLIFNNWDIKDDNNKILIVKGEKGKEAEMRYIVSDLGGTFGKTGSFMSRSRNDIDDYVKSRFVKGVKGKFVEFNYGGKRQDLFRNITVEQAKWMGSRLAKLSNRQIADAFRSSAYSEEEVQMLAQAFRRRINELLNL